MSLDVCFQQGISLFNVCITRVLQVLKLQTISEDETAVIKGMAVVLRN